MKPTQEPSVRSDEIFPYYWNRTQNVFTPPQDIAKGRNSQCGDRDVCFVPITVTWIIDAVPGGNRSAIFLSNSNGSVNFSAQRC
jgi:hypothetical protein